MKSLLVEKQSAFAKMQSQLVNLTIELAKSGSLSKPRMSELVEKQSALADLTSMFVKFTSQLLIPTSWLARMAGKLCAPVQRVCITSHAITSIATFFGGIAGVLTKVATATLRKRHPHIQSTTSAEICMNAHRFPSRLSSICAVARPNEFLSAEFVAALRLGAAFFFRLYRRLAMSRTWRVLTVVVCALAFCLSARAQQYGLESVQPIGGYLNGAFPSQAPSSGAQFNAVVAFPDLAIEQAMYMTPYPGSTYLAVVQKTGKLVRFPNRPDVTNADVQQILDIGARTFTSSDSGMTGLAFHPDFGKAGSPNRGYIYVTYKWRPNLAGASSYAYIRLSRFTIADGQFAADPASEQILLQQFDRQEFHDAGCLVFGLDGYLYFSIGDEGGGNDEFDVAQRINERLMSGMFRIDVDQVAARSHPIRRQPFRHPAMPVGWPDSFTANYTIPNDNPFVNANGSALEEYYVLGLRQPYRFSQDRSTGEIWLGESGQSSREEIIIVQAGSNYQWPYREGTIAGPGARPATVLGTERGPLHDYARDQGGCVIGGYVYRGAEHAVQLGGKYIFADNVSGRIFAVSATNGVLGAVEYLTNMPSGSVYGGTSSCGVDANGEIYFLKFGDVGANRIYKLAKAGAVIPEPPALLSQVGAFTNLATLTPAPGLIPYDVNAPLWSDRAEKWRWMAVPNDGVIDSAAERIIFRAESEWQFPKGTVFVKHFELPIDDANPALTRRIETRFLIMDGGGGSYGVTYKWRPDGLEADLLPSAATQDYTVRGAAGTTRTQTWSFPSRVDCTTCHNANANHVLGAKTHQLNGDFTYPSTGRTDNQLRVLGHLGLLDSSYSEAQLTSYLRAHSIYDNTASVEVRARSYLDANCAQCHQPGGVRALFDARFTTPIEQQGLIHGPLNDTINGPADRVVRPRDLNGSLSYNRASRVGHLQMPPIAKNVVDADAMALLAQWIESLPTGPGVSLTGIDLSAGQSTSQFAFNVSLTDPLGELTADMFVVTNGTVKGLFGIGTSYTLLVEAESADAVTVQFRPGTGANANYASNLVTISGPEDSALITWLPFNEGRGSIAADASGSGNTGALRNMSAEAWVPEQSGTALAFDGVDDFVETKNTTGQDFTLACWINTTQAFPQAGNTYEGTGILWSDVGGPAADFVLGATQSSVGVNRLSFFTGGGVNISINGEAAINTGDWVHIAATRSGTTGEMKIYVNGVLDGTGPTGGGVLNDNPIIHVGGNTLDGRYFNGRIDDVRIYSRALTGSEVADLLPTTPPRLTLSAKPTATGKFRVGAAFTRSVTGFSAEDIQITNGTLSALSGTGSQYWFTVEPYALGNVAVSVAANLAVSEQGVGNAASNVAAILNVTPALPSTGLVGRWTFDESGGAIAADSTSSGNTGALINMANTRVAGRFTRALALDGVNDYVQFANHVGDSFSLSLWVRTTQLFPQTNDARAGTGLLVSDNAASSRGIIVAGTRSAAGVNRISLFTGGTGAATVHGTSNIPLGDWVHVAAVRDKVAGTLRIFVNGVLEGTTTGVGTATLNGTPYFRLGVNTTTGEHFRGQVDETRIYNRALSSGEVAALALSGSQTPPQLVGRWKFDETTGLQALDASGAGNTGTVAGTGTTPWVLGRIGGALALDGVDDAVSIRNPIGESFSIALWVLTESDFPIAGQTSAGAGLVWSDTFGQASDFGLAIGQSSGVNQLLFSTANPSVSIAAAEEVSTGEWVHLAATRDRHTGELRTYVNGRLKGVGVGGTTSFALNPSMAIGAGTFKHFAGLIDDLRLYSGLLSPVNIAALSVGANPGENSYATWATRSLPGVPVAESARSADPDRDGFSNDFEFLFAMNPATRDASPFELGDTTGEGQQFSFRRRIDVGDIAYSILVSPDLRTWRQGGNEIVIESVERLPGKDYETITARFVTESPGLRARAFFKLEAAELIP